MTAVFLFKFFSKLYEKTNNNWFFISFVVISGFWIFGPVFFFEHVFLDKSNIFISFLGENILFRYLVFPLTVILLISLLLLLLASNIKKKFIQSLLCITPAIFVIATMDFSTAACTKSYSDNAVQELARENNKVKYIVKQNAKIYYPSFSDQEWTLFENNIYKLQDKKNIIRFPLFSPIKYSCDSFEKGCAVYMKKELSLDGRKYVKVTDGKKAGFVKAELLTRVEN